MPTPAELKQLLLERLNLSEEAQQEFLEPKYQLGDPFLFRDMEKSVERIQQAIENKEHVGIYSDYDCDGIPGAVVLVDFFKVLGIADRVHVYIPDRHDEGYGVNVKGIDELQALGVTLMITVDVGITALTEVADAQSRGMDVIVTDHHSVVRQSDNDGDRVVLPDAYAVVHPAIGEYPEKNLCGAATAFMLARAFLLRYGKQYNVPEGWEKWLLDLAGFATLSDMVSLTGENRVLVWYGMMVMRKTRRVGLQTLFSANSIDSSRLTESDLTFTVAPRLNAASRMASPALAFELLATEDRTRAMALVKELTKINDERKVLVARIVKEAHGRLAARELPDIVVIGDLAWRPAVLGLVAGKLQETYGKSFFVWGEGGDGTLKGSCRMIATHHAAVLMQALPEGTILHAGGHKAAGGFAVTKEQVHFFEAALNTARNFLAENEKSGSSVKVDEGTPSAFPLPLGCATIRHLQTVRSFAPFGVGNPEPVFLFENLTIESNKKFGKAKEHIECVVRDTTGCATAFTFFVDEDFCTKCTPGNTISILGTLEAGWRGGIRIRIKEIL
ncbi:MAG: recJ [Candidatus Nomurabacteria bacterium]|nr:recJ [Candidatus Nomurabacteria bacterium]